METKKLVPPELPPILPHGWKKEIALTLGIHQNTVSRALRAGKGITYMKIVKTATPKYGKKQILMNNLTPSSLRFIATKLF